MKSKIHNSKIRHFKSQNLFVKKKEEILGKEAYFECNVRNNQMFNNTELTINNIEEIENHLKEEFQFFVEILKGYCTCI